MKLLHLIDHVGAGGPFRSLLILIRQEKLTRGDIEHNIVSMQADAYAPLVFEARRLGVAVTRGPSSDELNRHVEMGDVVLLHFWNTPRLWQFLTRRPPVARYVIWSKVLGIHPPQILSPNLLAGMVEVVLTSAHPDIHLVAPRAIVVPGLGDFRRLDGMRSKPHHGFNADYVGTCNIGKIHPHFTRMMERIDIPEIAVRICGQRDAVLSESIRTSRDPSRFHTLGFIEDIRSIFETSDVFAYPPCETTYATSDKSLQEAMLAGIPPVVLPHGGPAKFVVDGETGIVARSEDEFVGAVEHLYRNPELRLTLGRNARDYALEAFAVERPTANLTRAIKGAADRVPRNLMEKFAPLDAEDDCDAERFLVSQAWSPTKAASAVSAWRAGDDDDLERYVAALPDEAFQLEGGILHWRNAIPGNGLLRYWSAMWLARQGRGHDAMAEIDAARRLGASEPRCAALEESAKKCMRT